MKWKSNIYSKGYSEFNAILNSFSVSFLLTTVLVLLATNSLQAQLCTGSLGSPIVNITFGSGTGKGPALDAATTTYIYSASGKLDEGYYTIANNTTGLRDNAWHATSDHTGNTNGYMMIVNSSFGAGIFYTKTVSDLCPNTTYEFSSWLMNTMNFTSQNPNITFTISTTTGTQLGTYSTGYLPVTSSPVWKQFGFYFKTGTETAVVIKIINNAPGAIPGNDLALDDITFRPCGPDLNATINGKNTVSVCQGITTPVQLNAAISSGYTNPKYQWQINSGAGWQNIPEANTVQSNITVTTPVLGTIYQYRLIVGEGSTSLSCGVISNIVTLTVDALPLAAFTVSKTACVSQSVEFTNISTPSANLLYQWNFGDGTASNDKSPTHNYVDTGTFYVSLIVTSTNTCKDTIDSPVAVQVFSLPHATFTVSNEPCVSHSVEFTNNSSPSLNLRYQWDFGDGTSSNQKSPTHDYVDTGIFYVSLIVTSVNACIDSIDSRVAVSIFLAPHAAFTISNTPCVSQAVAFSNNSIPSSNLLYQWDFGDGTASNDKSPTHIYANTGTFYVSLIVTSTRACTDTIDAPVPVKVYSIPHSEFTATPIDTTIFAPEVTITDLSSGGISCKIDWADNTFSNCSERTHIYQNSGRHNIMQVVTNEYGCTDTSYFSIYKKPEFFIFIPNAFTPNGDGNNDAFRAQCIGAQTYTMQIFNRWGEKLFESHNADIGWDGQYKSALAQQGVYVYYIELFDEKYLKWYQYKGTFTLLR